MKIQNVQRQNFGAIRISPKDAKSAIGTPELAAMTRIARKNKAKLESGMANDMVTFNFMTKSGSEKEARVMDQTREALAKINDKLTVEPIDNKEAKADVDYIYALNFKK